MPAKTGSLVAWFVAFFFLVIGLITLTLPHRIQQFALEQMSSFKTPLARFNPFAKWIESPSYIISLRAIGFASLIASVVIFYFLVRGR